MDILCLGLMVCDILVKPVPRNIMEKDLSLVDFVKMSNGGDAFNVAVNLSAMGVSTGIIGKIGDDEFGRFLSETAIRLGVDARGVTVTEECGTATCLVLIQPDGERNFAYYVGAGGLLCEEDIDYNLIGEAKILSVGGACLLPCLDGRGLCNVFKKAQSLGVKTSMDVSGDLNEKSIKDIKSVLPYTDIFVPSQYQARYITGKEKPSEMADMLLKQGAGLVIIKMGREGCFIASKHESLYVPAYDVEVKDTTGAGDSFVAGFLTSYLKGWTLYECGRFANAAGALCVQEIGATSGARSFREIQEFMKRFA